jgi:elongation factor P
VNRAIINAKNKQMKMNFLFTGNAFTFALSKKNMATSNDIKNGLCIEFNNDIYIVREFLHVKPGKGNAFVRTKLRSMTTGRVLEHTFPAGHSIIEVRVERKRFQYMYEDDMGLHFMDNETYDQISLSKDLFDYPQLLSEGMQVDVLFNTSNQMPLTAEMPQSVILQITYCEPAVAGNTATNATKPATCENGVTVQVPLFVNESDKIKVDTATCTYIERVK